MLKWLTKEVIWIGGFAFHSCDNGEGLNININKDTIDINKDTININKDTVNIDKDAININKDTVDINKDTVTNFLFLFIFHFLIIWLSYL
jgi:uncharacterized protein YdaL